MPLGLVKIEKTLECMRGVSSSVQETEGDVPRIDILNDEHMISGVELVLREHSKEVAAEYTEGPS